MTYDKWLAFDHHFILRIKNLCFGLGLGILLNNWTFPVVCVTPGRDRVAGKDLWTHFFQEVQKSLSSAPPGVRGRPLGHIQEAAWCYGYTEMLDRIRNQSGLNISNEVKTMNLTPATTNRVGNKGPRSFHNHRCGLLPSPGWKCF